MKKKIRMISVVLTVVLLMSVFVTPVAAGRENDRGRRNVPPPEVQYLDAEVRVIGGQPFLMAEVPQRFGRGKEYVSIPLNLPQVIPTFADGQTIELEVKNNYVHVPTKDGIVAVSITDFCARIVDGHMILMAEVNPLPIIIGVALGGVAGLGAGAAGVAALKSIGIVVSPTVAKWIVLGSGAGGAYMGYLSAPRR